MFNKKLGFLLHLCQLISFSHFLLIHFKFDKFYDFLVHEIIVDDNIEYLKLLLGQ